MRKAIIVVLVLLYGCTAKEFFPVVIDLDGQEVFLEEYFSPFVRITVSDSLFAAVDEQNDPMIFVYSLPSFKLISNIGKSGNGPGELLSISRIKFDEKNHIWAYDYYKTTFFAFDIKHDVSINAVKIFEDEKPLFTPYANFISDREYAVYRPAVDGMGIFQLFYDGKCIKSIGKLPVKDANIPQFAFAQSYQALSEYSVRLKKMALAYRYTNKIDIVDMVTDSIISIHVEKFYDPIYSISEDNYFQVTPNTICAYNGIDVDDKYIYALYAGNKFFSEAESKEIHVFDWYGNPICKFMLSHEAIDIAVSKNSKKIYTISPDTNNNPVVYDFNID